MMKQLMKMELEHQDCTKIYKKYKNFVKNKNKIFF